MLPEYVLQQAAKGGTLETTDGIKGHVDIVAHIWYIVVAHMYAPEGSERRAELRRHIRSTGWAYYFGSPSALSRHTHLMDLLARGSIGSPGMEEEPATLEITGGDGLEGFEEMGVVLATIWNNTGDFVMER